MAGYQEIYGVTLDEYCQAHGITRNELIKKTETDIKLLKSRLSSLVNNNVCDPLVNEVFQLLKKKEKHLKRLKGWKRNGKNGN